MLNEIKGKIKTNLPGLLAKSLNKAAEQQRLEVLRSQLKDLVPDISEQYTEFKIDDEYTETKVRNMHAFQVSLVQPVINEFPKPVIVDIGDSSGTHLQYLSNLSKENNDIRCLSVNLDKHAVEKIKAKNLEAVNAHAEDLEKYNINANIFLCFQTLEHLMNPCQFLHNISTKTKAKYFIITVPYLKNSRVGLWPLRQNRLNDLFSAEATHIFELSPEDWKLLFQFSGWKVDYEQIYYQYPKSHWLGITKPYWKKYDFEGFYGVRLVRDDTWSSRYPDW